MVEVLDAEKERGGGGAWQARRKSDSKETDGRRTEGQRKEGRASAVGEEEGLLAGSSF